MSNTISSLPSSSSKLLSSSSMLQTQTAAVLYGPKDLRMETRPILPPRAGEVQVKILTVGLCGSDLHYYLHARNGDFAMQTPLVLGHEAVGVITAIGPLCESGLAINSRSNGTISVGQRVVLEPGLYCGTCSFCKNGRYNLCKGMRFCSSAKTFPHLDGMLVEKINHPRGLIWPIPSTLPTPLAALAEPLCVLLHAASRGRLVPSLTDAFVSNETSLPLIAQNAMSRNKAVLVFGVGTIGLLACALSKFLGARKVCAVDIDSKRLDFARSQGWADDTWCLERSVPPSKSTGSQSDKMESILRAKNAITPILERFGEPDGFDAVFECTGVETCIQMGVFGAMPGSTLLLIGMGSIAITLPVAAAATREVDMIGCFRYAGTWAEAVRILAESASGEIGKGLGPVDRLLTHRIPSLAGSAEAFELVSKGRDQHGNFVLKVLVGEGCNDL